MLAPPPASRPRAPCPLCRALEHEALCEPGVRGHDLVARADPVVRVARLGEQFVRLLEAACERCETAVDARDRADQVGRVRRSSDAQRTAEERRGLVEAALVHKDLAAVDRRSRPPEAVARPLPRLLGAAEVVGALRPAALKRREHAEVVEHQGGLAEVAVLLVDRERAPRVHSLVKAPERRVAGVEHGVRVRERLVSGRAGPLGLLDRAL